MANTEKGKHFLKRIGAECQWVSIREEECMQPNLKTPAQDFGGRDAFWTLYKKYGLEWTGKRLGYLDKTLWDKMVILGMRVFDKAKNLFGA